jgi:hypothetical protein
MIMLKNSLLSRSGQLWKFVLAVVALLVGSFAPLYPALGISWTVGTIIAVVGYVFGLAMIQCTSCNARWLWEATKGSASYAPLFKKSPCPDCGHEFG